MVLLDMFFVISKLLWSSKLFSKCIHRYLKKTSHLLKISFCLVNSNESNLRNKERTKNFNKFKMFLWLRRNCSRLINTFKYICKQFGLYQASKTRTWMLWHLQPIKIRILKQNPRRPLGTSWHQRDFLWCFKSKSDKTGFYNIPKYVKVVVYEKQLSYKNNGKSVSPTFLSAWLYDLSRVNEFDPKKKAITCMPFLSLHICK